MRILILETSTTSAPSWVTILDDWKWPIVVFLIILIFFKTVKDLLKRFSKGKLLGAELELIDTTTQPKQQEISINKDFTTLQKSVAFFNAATIELFRGFVIKESEIETLATNEKKIDNLTTYGTILYIKYRFDELYTAILGSQLKLLLHLNTVVGIGETYETLKTFYDKALEENPAAYKGYSYEEYFNFLINRNLIIKSVDRYIITILGVDFVKYIPEANKNYNKPF